jgi:hypothetical protein
MHMTENEYIVRRLTGLVLMFACGLSVAQESVQIDERSGRGKVLQLVRTETPPVIDGEMDEVWSTGALMDDFHQTDPVEYAEPTEKTVVRILFDEDFLYVSGMMYYSDPSQIVANKMIQGANLRFEDKLRLYINPFNDGRTGYMFQTNANGIRTDGIMENVTERNFDWTGIWYAAAKYTDYGWFAEIAVPHKTISFDPESDSWGLSILRSIENKAEDIAWTSYNRNIDPSNFGTVTGLTGLEQGKGLDVIPGLSVTGRRDYIADSSDTDTDPSLDVFYKFTPNLTGALTFNSDFSATDVDARQVQLTRFSLFFPEQRKFFLQDADIFDFGGLDRNGKPFFSRRIGIGRGGQQLDLEAGGKLTGRIGRWNVGALAVKQGDNADLISDPADLINESELFVGRVSANILGQSTIGFIATHGNPREKEDGVSIADASNSLVGADFNYLNTRSFDNVTIEGRAWYQQSDSEGYNGDDSAWGVKLVSPNQTGWKGRVQYTSIGENFFPALGFVNRRGIEQSEAGIGHTKRFGRGSLIRSMENTLVWTRVDDMQGNLESELFEFNLAQLENQNGDEASLKFHDIREVLTEPFSITPDVTIPVGDYSYKRYGVMVETGGHRKLATTLLLEDGDFFNGKRKTANVKLDWQPSKHFTGTIELEYNDIELFDDVDQQKEQFNTRLMRLKTEVAFNSSWAWITTAQYDNQSEFLSVNSRLQWIPKAGQEFYLIYNAGWLDGGWVDRPSSGFRKVGQSATAKLSYTFRF